jgi:hypothetical protein
MAFEFKKFLLENKLTTGSKLKSVIGEAEENTTAIYNKLKDSIVSDEILDHDDLKANPDYQKLSRADQRKLHWVLVQAAEMHREGLEPEEDSMQDEPTAKDLKAGSKSTAELAKKQNQLAVLLKHKDELLDQYKKGEISIEQYKEKIGNIPQHIKNLTAQIEKATIADDQLDEYEMGDESNKLSHHEKVGAIIDILEDNLEGSTEYTELQLRDIIEDYAYDHPMSDESFDELFFDVEEKLYDLGYEKVS